MAKRKIVEIAAYGATAEGEESAFVAPCLFARADDGTLWVRIDPTDEMSVWLRMADLPDTDEWPSHTRPL